MGDPAAGEMGEAGQALWRYWRGLPAQDCVPHRRDFDPMAIARHLPSISITERLGPGEWRIRLAGTGIRERAGVELTGVNFLTLIDPARRDLEERRLELLLAHPCGTATLRAGRRVSGLVVQDRTVALPLRDNEGSVRLLVSSSEDMAADPAALDNRLTGFQILERRYLDLGAGVPEMPE